MSYARFGWEGSNVYVFLDCDGYLSCCGCWLQEDSARFYSTAEMVEHLHAHRVAGHTVVDDTIADLLADAAENDAWIAEFR